LTEPISGSLSSPHNTVGSPLTQLGGLGLVGSPVSGSFGGNMPISVGTSSLIGSGSSIGSGSGSGMSSFSGVPRVDSPKKMFDENDIMTTFGTLNEISFEQEIFNTILCR